MTVNVKIKAVNQCYFPRGRKEMMRAECFRVKDSTPIWRLIEGFIRIFKKSLKIGRWPKINNFLEGEAAQCVKVVNGVNMFESKIKRAVWHWHWMILMWSFFFGDEAVGNVGACGCFFLTSFSHMHFLLNSPGWGNVLSGSQLPRLVHSRASVSWLKHVIKRFKESPRWP